MTPTLKQLEAFYWVVKLGSFRSAANRLHVTPSTVSKRISELEQLFGAELFDRSHRRPRLSEQGKKLSLSTEDMLAAHQRMMAAMSDSMSFQGIFRLGTSELVALTWLPKLIEAIKREHPAVVIELEVGAGGNVVQRLSDGLIDLALVAGPLWGRQLESIRLSSVDFSWMASPSLEVPRRAMTPPELSAYPTLMHSPHGIATQIYSAWQRKSGFEIRRSFTANSLLVMAQMTMSGLGISCLPTRYFKPFIDNGQLVEINTDPALPELPYFAVYRKDGVFPFVQQVIKLANETCDFDRPSGLM